jgi:hypothetical protein
VATSRFPAPLEDDVLVSHQMGSHTF